MPDVHPGEWVDAFLRVLGAAPWPDYIWIIVAAAIVVKFILVPLIRAWKTGS